jgi:hypothetical protein
VDKLAVVVSRLRARPLRLTIASSRLDSPGSIHGSIPSHFAFWTALTLLFVSADVDTNCSLTSPRPHTGTSATLKLHRHCLANLANCRHFRCCRSSTHQLLAPFRVESSARLGCDGCTRRYQHHIHVAQTHAAHSILENTKNTGTVPLALFNSSANLDSIHVVSDLMCGSLPSNIGLATSLRTLYDPQRANNTSFHSSCKTRMVGGHSFQGELPPELWQLTHLTSLVLNQGNFRILPTQIGRLTELVTLQIFACDVTGSIPSQLGYLSKLRTLFVRFNGFGGSLPREVLTLPSLSGLFVHNNRLTGTIGAISPSISSCFVQGYSDFADSNCMQCSAPCCDSVVASCAPRFDDCFAPKVLRGDGTTAFSTVNATALACMGCSAACVIRRDIWFEWSATCAGTATISVCDRDNVALVVYENGICPSPYAANGNDSDCTVWPVCASGRGAVTQATVVAGQKLLIRVGSLVANAGFDGSIQVDCAGAPAAIQCLHEQTSTTSTSTSITSTSTTTPATTTATTTTTTTTTIVDSTTAPMSTTTTDGMSSIAAPSSNSTTADNLATVNTDTSIAVVSRLSTTSRASSSSSAGSTSSSSSAGSPGSSVEDDNVRQSHADDGGALSPTVLNGIIGGVVALVAVLCIALIATAVLMRRAARANKRASPLAMSLRERRQSSQSQAQAFGSDYDRFPFPTEVADAAAHYEELAPQEVN